MYKRHMMEASWVLDLYILYTVRSPDSFDNSMTKKKKKKKKWTPDHWYFFIFLFYFSNQAESR